MSDKLIRLHKEANLMQIRLKKESLANVYYNLIDKYNKQHEYKPLEISKSDLWKIAGLKGDYNSRDLRELIEELTKSNSYTITENHKIAGSMFVVEYLNDKIKIYVPEPFRKLIFYKKDIDLMYKAKHKKVLSVAELDHYDKITKKKSKFLVLLKKADILGVKGKYNKRLYSLLGQFKKTGLYFTTWNDFKEILEIPKSYKSSNIDQKVFTPAKKELLKVGLEITEIKKIKKGRSIDRVEIRFKYEETPPRTPSVLRTSPPLDKEGENEVIEMSMTKRKALAELARKGKYHLIETLMGLETDKEVEEFMGGQ